ncbi:hypothetical protein BDA99DRAFT_522548 [Phascolomyces articulosus]|uniref:3'-5' exonuclease domain-containing protein n=1 Tax=Phascolomyces articulosus TaxID=60185 RepID=A0AAD5JRN8_9FUNG|nr:hypothetical protein BDA99DRAFT_522548 [Phascolomyces articulosus]
MSALPPTSALSMHDYWKSTVFACETALSLLKPFEHNDHYLVDNVLAPLRQLVGHGRNYEAMKAYQPPMHADTRDDNQPHTVTTTTRPFPSQYQSRIRKTVQLNFDPRTTWDIESNDTVHVHTYIQNNPTGQVTCKAIMTVEQLDAAIPIIQKAPCLGLDCEFLGLKKALPELQVLQIAVSSTLGYAIMVNHIGADKVYQRLGPILEEEFELNDDTTTTTTTNDDNSSRPSRLLLGWAFRADAQAIEASFRKIKLTRVLDLQAKIQSLETEQLNLASAMIRYCQRWDGLEEFSKAKQLGDTFQFTGPECIWLHSPLPPEALVYAVFDVVSLVALHEQTKWQPTLVNHYWPNTVISTYGRKALEKWYRQKIMAQQEPINPHLQQGQLQSQQQQGQETSGYISLVETPASVPPKIPVSTKKAGKAKVTASASHHHHYQTFSSGTTTNTTRAVPSSSSQGRSPKPFGWDDENPQYTADMEEAIRRSKQEYLHKQQSPTEERIIGTLDEPSGSGSSFHCETIDFNDMPEEYTTTAPEEEEEDYHLEGGDEVIEYGSYQRREQQKNFDGPEEDPPFENKTDNNLHFADDIYDDSQKKKEVGQLGGWGSSDEIQETNWISQAKPKEPNGQQQPVPISTTKGKGTTMPSTFSETIHQAYHQHAEGEFAWTMRPEDETWSKLAEDSRKGWRKRKMTAMTQQTYDGQDEKQGRTGSKGRNGIGAEKTTKFQTSTHFGLGSWAYDEKDSWDTKNEQPQAMRMPLRNIPKVKVKGKNRQRGPRVVNPYDDMMSSSDEDESDEDISMSDTDDASSLYGTQKINNNNNSINNKVPIDETYRDDLHLDGESVHVHLIQNDLQLSTVQLNNEKDFSLHTYHQDGSPQQLQSKVVFITPLLRQVVHREGTIEVLLKGLQIYVAATEESYTLLTDRLLNRNQEIQHSELGHVLVDPSVTRVVWGITIVERQIQERLGFSLGPCIDLAWVFNEMFGSPENPITFNKALDMGLQNTKNRDIYHDLSETYHSRKKFSGSPWDQERLQSSVLHYSAMQGWLLSALFQFVQSVPEIQVNKFILPPESTVASTIQYTIAT